MKYVYFICGGANKSHSASISNAFVERDSPLDSLEKIKELEKDVCKNNGFDSFVLFNFQLLRTEEE